MLLLIKGPDFFHEKNYRHLHLNYFYLSGCLDFKHFFFKPDPLLVFTNSHTTNTVTYRSYKTTIMGTEMSSKPDNNNGSFFTKQKKHLKKGDGGGRGYNVWMTSKQVVITVKTHIVQPSRYGHSRIRPSLLFGADLIILRDVL